MEKGQTTSESGSRIEGLIMNRDYELNDEKNTVERLKNY